MSVLLFILLFAFSCQSGENQKIEKKPGDLFSYAETRTDDLQLGIYITAHAVKNLLSNEAGRREAISIFRCNGITRAYIEVYRSGLVIEQSLLEEVRDMFLQNDIAVTGGIATVPGDNFGVRQEGPLGWFNWQNPKTQEDLKAVMKMSAAVFDEFIVDDFLCTSDTSLESKSAKGDRSWSEYRRDLLTRLSTEIFIEPARSVNPGITMIIKYPQWYDRFHLFGYELAREPQLFDKVWVGTESRGQYTQRFGFVQPYEGFVNYRWIASIAGKKTGGAWFDHGDCDQNDFIEQAWQAVAAGAKEIVLFNYFDFVNGHRGHHLLRYQFEQLADLAKAVAAHPVTGVAGYKPVNSDAGGDLYLMDFIGMLGIPLVPVHRYPENAKVVFLPTQAAADEGIFPKVEKSLANGTTVIFTTGFLAAAKDGEKLAALAGVHYPVKPEPVSAAKIMVNNKTEPVKYGLDLESRISLAGGISLLHAVTPEGPVPLLIKSGNPDARIYTLNTHTFSQKDFDKVGEVLLCPKPPGLLEIPESWANTLREPFNSGLGIQLKAPTRIVIQPLGSSGWLLHNYSKKSAQMTLKTSAPGKTNLTDGFTGKRIDHENDILKLTLKPRSRTWIKTEQ